jgi:hypothetical protein
MPLPPPLWLDRTYTVLGSAREQSAKVLAGRLLGDHMTQDAGRLPDRDELGRAAYDAADRACRESNPLIASREAPWQELAEVTKEVWRAAGEAAAARALGCQGLALYIWEGCPVRLHGRAGGGAGRVAGGGARRRPRQGPDGRHHPVRPQEPLATDEGASGRRRRARGMGGGGRWLTP